MIVVSVRCGVLRWWVAQRKAVRLGGCWALPEVNARRRCGVTCIIMSSSYEIHRGVENIEQAYIDHELFHMRFHRRNHNVFGKYFSNRYLKGVMSWCVYVHVLIESSELIALNPSCTYRLVIYSIVIAILNRIKILRLRLYGESFHDPVDLIVRRPS